VEIPLAEDADVVEVAEVEEDAPLRVPEEVADLRTTTYGQGKEWSRPRFPMVEVAVPREMKGEKGNESAHNSADLEPQQRDEQST